MKNKILIGSMVAAIIFTYSAVCFGQGGQRLSDQAAGYSFTLPSGWKSNKGEAGFAMVDPDQTVIVSVKAHSYNNFQAVVGDTNLEGFQLAGEPQDLKNGGKAVRVTKKNVNGLGVVDFFVLFSPNGGGVVVMALSDSTNSVAAFNAGLGISNSVSFTRTQPGASIPQAGSASGWQAAFAGKHLLYLYSGNGYFEEKHIYLCRDGSFLQKTGTGGYTPGNSDGGSFAGRGGHRGTWNVSGTTLVLQFQDGDVGRYNITQRSARNEVGLNGKRYFVQSNSGC
jgi:hypothetical protein